MISRGLFFKGLFIVMMVIAVVNSGCSTLDGLFSDPVSELPQKEDLVTFSDNPQMSSPANRQYRRMTKNAMEDESELQAQAGSMWVMEGQGAYLFAQNKTRREGDLLNVKVEGAAQKQVETKVTVIKKLLKQLEDQEKGTQPPVQQNMADGGKPGADEPKRAPASEPKEEKAEPLEIDVVPTRIVERLADGNYRVKGAQPFMIDKREYKMIVTGIIRPEDYNDEGVSSNKLLDPQFDVVSIRRNQQ